MRWRPIKRALSRRTSLRRTRLARGEIKWETVVSDASGKELERLAETAPLPVHSPAGYQTAHETIIVNPGETREIHNTKFLDDERVSLGIVAGASPMLRLQKALEYVVGYPYGCVEQTTSRLMPMYLLRKNAAFGDTVFKEINNLDAIFRRVLRACSRCRRLREDLGTAGRESAGGLRGRSTRCISWTMVKRGRDFEIPEQNFKALQEYARGIALDSKRDSDSGLYMRAYALYVLALDGDLKAIQQIDRFNEMTLPKTARYLLAAALAQNTKDLERAKLYLSNKPSRAYTVSEPDAALTSDARNTAIELIALQQLGGDQKEILARVNALVDFLGKHYYGNTHESAFIISALTDYLTKQAESLDSAAATITAGDKPEEMHGPRCTPTPGKDRRFVYRREYGQDRDLVNVTSKGVPEKVETKAETHGLKVERTFYSSKGEVFEGDEYKQTDSYIVRAGNHSGHLCEERNRLRSSARGV